VCSAISGVSDALEAILSATADGHPEAALQQLRQTHATLATELGVDMDSLIADDLEALNQSALGAALVGEVTPRLHARLMAMGELMSTRLGAAFLQTRGIRVAWVDARKHLTSIDEPNVPPARRQLQAQCSFDANPTMATNLESLDADVIVTQGFIAADTRGETVLLGRGGSDTSAAYFAAKLQAERCEIWTDVPGMFSADPRQLPSARVLERLGFDEAQECSTMGAKVLHPRAIPPCRTHGIPIHIRCTPKPDLPGTIIQAGGAGGDAEVKAISTRKGVMLVSMETVGMWQCVGFLADAFAHFKSHGLSIDLVSTSETNVTVSLDPSANDLEPGAVDALLEALAPICEARLIGPCASISLVGRQIRSILHKLGGVLSLFEEQRIHLMSQAASDLNLTFVVDESQADRLVAKLHAQLFGSRGLGSGLGPTWEALFHGGSTVSQTRTLDWWRHQQQALLKIAGQTSPCYAYHLDTVDQATAKLASMESIDRRFYAIKANAHPDILRRIHAAGFGFECVSPGEVDHVRALFSDLPKERLLFTPNFAGPDEYTHGFTQNAMVTVDNLHPLTHWPERFAGQEILVRLDPGRGRGHHAHVRTAGARSKFGIAPDEIDRLVAAAGAAGATVVGLHAHSGSGVLTTDGWAHTAEYLASVAARFPAVRALDLGGGLGIAEKPDQIPLDLAAVDASLRAFKNQHPTYELWLEPGRFLVAQAGVLLARVTQIKQKGPITYVGVNAGMNSLIRPALYGAYHPILNLTRLDSERTQLAHVVGPICETGDVLGHARHLAPAQEGDVLLIGNAGAYGRTMACNYNLRPPADEVVL